MKQYKNRFKTAEVRRWGGGGDSSTGLSWGGAISQNHFRASLGVCTAVTVCLGCWHTAEVIYIIYIGYIDPQNKG